MAHQLLLDDMALLEEYENAWLELILKYFSLSGNTTSLPSAHPKYRAGDLLTIQVVRQ